MRDQGIVGGAALGLKDALDCRGIQRVRAETVDGFRWECDQTTGANHFSRPGDGIGIWSGGVDMQDDGFRLVIHCAL